MPLFLKQKNIKRSKQHYTIDFLEISPTGLLSGQEKSCKINTNSKLKIKGEKSETQKNTNSKEERLF